MFDEGFEFLQDSLPWRYITYQRGSHQYHMKAVRGGTSWLDLQRYGSNGLESSSRDYIVSASEFVDEAFPTPRDLILDSGETWTVVASVNNECWRYCGPDRKLIRIHCRR